MRCKICNKKTNYDKTVGRDSFLVCNDCVYEITTKTKLRGYNVIDIILAIGFMKEKER